MESLEAELDHARDLAVDGLADAIESIGFECTRCGACCRGYVPDGDDDAASEPDTEPHTATVFPDEARELLAALEDERHTGDQPTENGEDGTPEAAGDDAARAAADGDDGEAVESYDWRDVARPMPYGLEETPDGDPVGETFEWALQTDSCGDCTFYRETDGQGACTVHDDRPLVCRTYPFSVALGGTTQPMGEAVDEAGLVRAHECEGLGRDISRDEAEELAGALKRRAVRELEEAIAVRDAYRPSTGVDGVVIHDSEGQKRPDGTPIDGADADRER
ncbi:hypothetical protein SAMN05192561_101225 [Halopenitus malekzadehii]|uniref:Uncharacterized protein n=1 Tax=Halopenitus malekzadehii TaxID=1267564 RepID=A0A1H6HP61_9EURY|nr:YkgJ family cysteine cluster protein [Halopenitus malekzadehii]SEH37609.1 hypothetical protein SAMN05192561_101225 [Halopenitus malekzadehii]